MIGQPDSGQSDAIDPTDSPPPSLRFDGWELGEQLKHVERVLAAEKTTRKMECSPRIRVDQAHELAERHHRPQRSRPSRQRTLQVSSFLSVVIWPLMGVGLMAFVCGGVLVGWSLLTGRNELWTLGLPTALIGQIGLLTGLLFQLERIWGHHRTAVAKLEHVDEELHDLKTTTTLLSTTHSPAGAAFYAHLAGGASPQLLLTDLKSQLDLLAVKLGESDQRG